jgi:peroxiredoxin
MKQILLIFTVVTLISCQEKRDSYLIQGNITGVPDSTVIDLYVQYDNMGQRINSDTIINGYFEFSDTLEARPSKMNLRMRDWNNYFGSCDLWVDHEVIEISGTGKYLSAWKASGNNDELKALNRLKSRTRELSVITDSLYMLRMNNRKDKELLSRIRKTVDSIGQISCKIEIGLIEENPNSQSALEMLYSIAKFDTSIAKNRIKSVYDKLDTIYQNTLYGEGILTIIEDKPIPNIGDKIVDFVAYDTEGEKHSLREFEGKYILLDFWALACGPCKNAIPETRELYSNNKEILTVVGINMVTNEDSWRETSKKDSITWINLSDGKGTFAGISADYGINGFPTYILIDPQGVIIEKWMGYWPNVFKQKLENHIDGLKI